MKKTMTTARLAALVALAVALSGCATTPFLFTGGTTAAVVANDGRSAGAFVEDQGIELKASVELNEKIGNKANINVVSYNRRVLLTGQVPDEALRRQMLDIINNINNVRQVLDQTATQAPSSLTSRAADTALTARVKTALCRLQESGFSCLDVKVVTEQGIVYLLGLTSKKIAAIAVRETRNISGVQKVIKVFEYSEEAEETAQ